MASEVKVRHDSIKNTQNACALKAQPSPSRRPTLLTAHSFIQNSARKSGVQRHHFQSQLVYESCKGKS